MDNPEKPPQPAPIVPELVPKPPNNPQPAIVAEIASEEPSARSKDRAFIIKVILMVACAIGSLVIIFVLLQKDANELAEKYGHHPIVVEQLGGINSASYNFSESKKRRKVYDVEGPRGSGQILTHEVAFMMVSVKLRTADGEWELLE